MCVHSFLNNSNLNLHILSISYWKNLQNINVKNYCIIYAPIAIVHLENAENYPADDAWASANFNTKLFQEISKTHALVLFNTFHYCRYIISINFIESVPFRVFL